MEDTTRQALCELAELPGVRACALVEGSSGLVWHTVGALDDDHTLWEAAVDYWRLYRRSNAHFAILGDLGAAVMYHRRGVLAILPCQAESELLVVGVAAHHGVNWIDFQRRVRLLGDSLRTAPQIVPV